MNDWTTWGIGPASWVEITWVTIATVMLIMSIHTVRYSISDYRKVKQRGYNSLVEATAKDNIVTAIVRAIIQVGFLLIGWMLVLSEPIEVVFGIYFRIVVGLTIFAVEAAIIVAVISANRTRKYLIAEIDKENDDKRSRHTDA